MKFQLRGCAVGYYHCIIVFSSPFSEKVLFETVGSRNKSCEWFRGFRCIQQRPGIGMLSHHDNLWLLTSGGSHATRLSHASLLVEPVLYVRYHAEQCIAVSTGLRYCTVHLQRELEGAATCYRYGTFELHSSFLTILIGPIVAFSAVFGR